MLPETKRLTMNEMRAYVGKRNGKLISPPTVWRWVVRGTRGTRLRSELIFGIRYTCAEWIEDFLTALNESRNTELGIPNESTLLRPPSKRRRESERAARRLDRIGA